MLLTQEQINSRINSDKNIANESNITVIRKDGIYNHVGNGGAKKLTEEERIAIGYVAAVTDDQTSADLFSISKSHANDLKRGARNATHDNQRITDVGLLEAIGSRLDKTKLDIQERAAEKLLSAMGLFDSEVVQEKMRNSAPKEISAVVKDMSQVMRNIESRNKVGEEGKRGIKIILHSPKEASESSFDMIEIGV